MEKVIFRCIPFFVLALALGTQEPAVKVREDQVTLPTYDEGAPVATAAVEVSRNDMAARALIVSATDPEQAAALFNEANFPKEKQPDAVRRAYIEVQLQLLLDLAHRGKCRNALANLETLGDEDTNVPFTLYGFGSFMKSAHFQYYLAVVENACGDEKAAKKRWSKLSRSSESIDSIEYVYPYLAAKNLGESDARPRVDAALQALGKTASNDSRPAITFSRGALLIAAGKTGDGDALLQKSLQAGDSFVQYLSLAVMAEASRR